MSVSPAESVVCVTARVVKIIVFSFGRGFGTGVSLTLSVRFWQSFGLGNGVEGHVSKIIKNCLNCTERYKVRNDRHM